MDGGNGIAQLFDLIQARYGWTDEIIHGLLFVRFLELAQLSLNAIEKEAKEKVILAAFIGHQLGAGGKKDFPAYLEELGLADERPNQSEAVTDAELASMGIMKEKR